MSKLRKRPATGKPAGPRTTSKAVTAGAASKTKARATKAATKTSTAVASKPTPRRDPLDALIDAAAAAIDLPVEPAWKPAVKANLAVTLQLAKLFGEFPLPDDAEPAPVFVA